MIVQGRPAVSSGCIGGTVLPTHSPWTRHLASVRIEGIGVQGSAECKTVLKISGNHCLSLRRNWGRIRQSLQLPFGSCISLDMALAFRLQPIPKLSQCLKSLALSVMPEVAHGCWSLLWELQFMYLHNKSIRRFTLISGSYCTQCVSMWKQNLL